MGEESESFAKKKKNDQIIVLMKNVLIYDQHR